MQRREGDAEIAPDAVHPEHAPDLVRPLTSIAMPTGVVDSAPKAPIERQRD